MDLFRGSLLYVGGRCVPFRPKLLALAHGRCLRNFVAVVADTVLPGAEDRVAMVDNTNTTLVEIAPYVALANAYNHDVEIHVWVPREQWAPTSMKLWEVVLAERNTHGVGREAITRMLANIEHTLGWWPRFWPKPVKHYLEE